PVHRNDCFSPPTGCDEGGRQRPLLAPCGTSAPDIYPFVSALSLRLDRLGAFDDVVMAVGVHQLRRPLVHAEIRENSGLDFLLLERRRQVVHRANDRMDAGPLTGDRRRDVDAKAQHFVSPRADRAHHMDVPAALQPRHAIASVDEFSLLRIPTLIMLITQSTFC
ncbi:hypothetical protein, partial [Rhodoblastus sphagnicola]|uniref:hypothetical protein n=1 Tax=Rhodoblastus sphagnicola TaxID=333368 RepID=UPI001AEEF115